MEQEGVLLSWETPEYSHNKKSADWFLVLAILAITGVTVSLLLHNILLAILLFIGALVIALFAAREPQLITVTLTEKGIIVGNRVYLFSKIRSFCVTFKSNPIELILELHNVFLHQLVIPINEVRADDVRLFLANHIVEKEQKVESLTDHLAHRLGF